MSEKKKVSSIDGTSRVDHLTRDPARAVRVAAIRDQKRDADRTHSMTLPWFTTRPG